MEIINKPTKADQLERMARDPVYFSQKVGTDYDPRPCQIKLLRAPLEPQISITSKKRQCGASESMAHFVAWSMFAKPRGWKCYIVAPNESIAGENLDRIHNIFASTPLLRDNLKHCVKNNTEFKLTKVNRKTELLLVGESGGNARRGITIKGGQGIIWYEELHDISRAETVLSTLSPATAWGGGLFFCGTKRGFSGAFYDKFQYISAKVAAGIPGYAVYEFPLIEFVAERHGGKGIKLQWLRDRREEEPRHIWLREFCGQFCDPSGMFFDEESIRNCWQQYESEGIQQYPHHDMDKQIILGIDWGMLDRTVLCYAADNVKEDRLEHIHLETLRDKKACKGKDIPIDSFDEVVRLVCNLRDRGLDPTHVYCDKNNRGGVFSDRLANEHGFNIVDASWNSNTTKTQCLRSLSNLFKAGRFLFPNDERILEELNSYNPEEHPDTGKYIFRDKKYLDDIISAMAQMSDFMGRESQPSIFSASTGDSLLGEQWNNELPFAAVY